MRHGRIWRALSLMVLFGCGVFVLAQPPKAADEPTAEELKEKAIADRFRAVLEKTPRRGTALDRLYGYHVERGTLDKLIAEYADRTKANPKDGVSWHILGMIESQRGKDAAAVAAFRKAEEHLPDNAIPGYYLGQSLVLVGQPEAAAEAYERAITRKPSRNDLLDIFQALGRVYQRAQRTDKALDVWNRLEKLYPDDARVQEQIATTLVEEGQFDQALPRLERLASKTDDKYRQSQFRIDIAELKVKLKKSPEAIADFEKLLAELNPDNWLYRDVRRRVEDVFLRGDDLAGLAKYYEKWLDKNPSDVDAIARLAKNLATQGRAPEARKWLEKGLEVAPANRGLRLAVIEQLVFEQNFAAAATHYEAMDKADPNNPDTLRDWGKLLMKDTAKPEADRRTAASAIWKKLLEKKPNDPVTTSQVADLLRSANAVDEAIQLYTKAILLAPDAPQYREYLGEYFHSMKRGPEALGVWRPMAEGPNRNAKNLARLAEVLAGFGYKKEAIAAMGDAVSLDKDDFGLLMTYSSLLHDDGQHDLALQQIDAASKKTSNAEEVEQILMAQIKVYQATDKLPERIDALEKELSAGKDITADRLLRLARYFEANRQMDKASEAIAKALEKDTRSIPVGIAAARIYEASGNMLAASEMNRKLAAIDRRYRTEYLTAVAKLEQRLGRREQALQAGRDLLAASPGNPETYKFYADLCFQLGDQEEGLEALRRSVRANPGEPAGLITLANALSERIRQGEAIELLWRAFEKTNDLEGRLGIVDRITQLYLENNQFDRLVERLERERRESDKAREMTMCLAQAYSTAGDLGTARSQLEKLLTENNRDTGLLGQLVSLCENEGDIAAALKYHRQLVTAAPNNYDHQLKLAQLLTRSGESEEAADIWVKLVANETEPHRNLSAIDALVTAGKHDNALAILSRMLAQKPGDWELLYREGASLVAKGKPADAAVRFNAVLALKTADDELSAITKNQIAQAKKKAKSPGSPTFNPYASRYDENTAPPLQRRQNNSHRIRYVVGMEARDYYGGGQGPAYTPADYGEVRMVCLGFLSEFARAKGEADAFTKKLRDAKDKAGTDPRPAWDWLYFQTLRNEYKDRLATAFALSKGADPSGLVAYLNAVSSRTYGLNQRSRRSRSDEPGKDTTPPLPDDQLAHTLACFGKLKSVKPEWVTSDITQTVMTELKRAKKEGDETAIYQGIVKDATTIDKVQSALQLASTRKDLPTAVMLFQKLDQLQGPAKTASALAQLPTRQATGVLEYLVASLADDKKLDDALKVFDMTLSTARRQNLSAPPTASTSRRAPQSGGLSGNVPGKGQKRYQVSYPSPNDYYDFQLLHLMYTAFAKYRDADVLSDLFAHIQKQVNAAQGTEKMYMHLALGYLHWWNDEKDESIAQLLAAVALVPNDHNLVMEVASLREQNGEPGVALALLDSIVPLDTQMMQRREDMAMRLAERTGNVDRARLAAERMFGLRLDADKQLDLAAKMHRLGLPQLAETVLNRAQRQAGNKSNTLVRLMSQYQSQNQTDMAVAIARQILRKAPTGNINPQRGYDESENYRNQAVGVLARSGQLKEIIERAEAQLKASPKSIQIHQSLVGYYQAAGDKDKVRDTLKKMADLRPDDGKLKFSVAQQLSNVGERDAALVLYTQAIKLDPSQFSNRYWEIQQLYAQANKFEDLAKLFDEIDMRKLGSYWSVFQIISSMVQSDQGRELGLKLFKKAWDAYPQQRGQLLGYMQNDAVWRLPEIFAYAKEAVIPRPDSEVDAWGAAADIVNYGSEGRVEGVLTRLMSIARKQQSLPELKADVVAAMAKRPDWVGGKAMLAVIEVQLGNKDAGRKLWNEAFTEAKDIPPLARFILAQELEFYSGMEETAVKTLEAGIDEMMKDGDYEYSYHPGRRLVWWYDHLGRTADAKALNKKFATADNFDPNRYGGGYGHYRQITSKINIASEFMRTDPIESVRILNALLADRDTLDAANNYYGGEQFDQQIENGLRVALRAIKPAMLPTAVAGLLTPREVTATNKSALDLVVILDSRDLTKATVNSVFASAIKSTEKTPDVRKDAIGKLAALVAKHPTDVSVQTAAALAAFADAKPEAIREAVDRLAKLAGSIKLEALPPSGRANARQRADALPLIPMWLAARECLGKDRAEYRAAGEAIAAKALAAAKRQQDPFLAAAILREWGQFDLDRGDKAKGEARWAEILDLMLPKPKPKAANAATAPPPPAAVPVPAPAVPVRPKMPPPPLAALHPETVFISAAAPQTAATLPQFPPPAGPGASGPVIINLDQFQHAYAVAKLAAEKGAPALSLRAMTDALKGGPPVPGKQDRNRGGGRMMTRMVGGQQYLVDEGGGPVMTVDGALIDLVPRWRESKVPAADIYDVLVLAVLPPSRPAEVFAYGEGRVYGTVYAMTASGSWSPTSDIPEGLGAGDDKGISGMLCDAAIDAGKVDDLRAKLNARLNQPLGELPAQVLLATLALRSKDDAKAVEVFKALGAKIQKDSLHATNERATSVLLPAFDNPKFADLVAPFIEKAAENFATSNNTQKAVELRFKLAQRALARKDEAGARAQYKIVTEFGKKVGRNEYDVHLPLAMEYIKAGWAADALRELGAQADRDTSADVRNRNRGRRSEPTLNEFPRFVRLVLDMPPAARYEALKGWTLPTEGRKSIRYFVGVMPKHVPLPAFGKFPNLPTNEVVSTMVLLADAAKECGKIDELAGVADKLAGEKEKPENAELLQVLVKLRQGKGKEFDAGLKAFAEAAVKRMTDKPQQNIGRQYYYDEDYENRGQNVLHPSEFLFAQMCLADPALIPHGELLLKHLLDRAMGLTQTEYLHRIRAMWDRLGATRAGSPDALLNGVPAGWLPATPRSQWFAQDGYLAQALNDQSSYLLLNSPLSGTFEFSVDVFQGNYTEGHAGYAGVVYEPNRPNVGSNVWSVGGGYDIVNKKTDGIRTEEFNTLTFKVTPTKVTCLLNGQVFYEDTDPPASSPWVMLYAGAGRRPVFRNFTLTGKPDVPAEVRLSGGHLAGWHTHLYGGSMPTRMADKEPKEGPRFDRYGNRVDDEAPQSQKNPKYDWQDKDGEILGRKYDKPGERPVPSKLMYFRPLQAGDTLKYEFFYEAGKSHTHPSLGRLAFLFDPTGVKLHWLTDGGADDWTGLAADNAVDDPAGRKTDKLPLKEGDWNAVTISTTADGVKIELNGMVVYESTLPDAIERLFGFFHYRNQTAVRVKNVVLTGTWAKTISATDAGLMTKPTSPAEAKARRWQLGERYYFTEAGDIVERANKLPAAERYKALAEWVLPNESRPAYQLAGAEKPLDVLGAAEAKSTGTRVMLGSRLDAPCLELVKAAKVVGKLDELADRVNKSESGATDDLYRRSRLAMLTAVFAAQGKDAEATDALAKLTAFAKTMAPDAHGPERWPDLIAATATLDRPTLHKAGGELAQAMNQNVQDSMVKNRPFDQRDWWVRASRGVRAKLTVAALPKSEFAHWASVPGVDANSRSQGWGVPLWSHKDGVVTHYPGHSEDFLILKTPLSGDFEVSCELMVQGWNEAHVRYGAYQFDLGHDRKKYKMHTTIRRNEREVTITPPLPAAKGNAYQFKMTVKAGVLRAFVDDREVIVEKIGANPDPWLMIHAHHQNTAILNNLVVTGTPRVPETIDLLAGEDLGMWRPYLGRTGNSNRGDFEGGGWGKRGEELFEFGKKPEPPDEGKKLPPRNFPESALFYQRPLVENGAVEYEFYYDPEKSHVHPTLDRLTFVLDPEGVKLHRLTDGPHEKSGTPFDNETVEKETRRGPAKLPLKEKAWNKVKLAVSGDTVKVSLNGDDVYERAIEPTNGRFFGLFHYTDRTEARVRSMTYTGEWAKALPAKLFEAK